MNAPLERVKDKMFDAVLSFFADARVVWAEQSNTKIDKLPYITLKFGTVSKNQFATYDEDLKTYYNCSVPLQMNLYTVGRKVTDLLNPSVTVGYSNTSVSDLTDFAIFLESEYMIDCLSELGIVVTLNNIQDLSALENDSKYRYRAMAEFQIDYTFEGEGIFALRTDKTYPNSSGGRSPSANEDKIINDVQITHEEVKK